MTSAAQSTITGRMALTGTNGAILPVFRQISRGAPPLPPSLRGRRSIRQLAVLFDADVRNTDDAVTFRINNSAVNKSCLTLTGDIPPGIPTPSIPEGIDDGELIKSLIAPAIVVALIGYLESIAIAKAFARQNGYEVQPSQELIAIGFGNIISGFFSSYPVTGSFSRTAVNSASGVASPASGLVTGAVVLLALQFATKVMEYIPAAALASIIIVSVIKMFNYQIVFKMLKVRACVQMHAAFRNLGVGLPILRIVFFPCTYLLQPHFVKL